MTNDQILKDHPFAKPALFVFASILSILLFGKDMTELGRLVMHEEEYSHLAVIPIITGFFLWSGRKNFINEKGNLISGIILIVIGAVYSLLLNLISWKDPVTPLSLKGFGVVLVIYGIFVSIWGYSGFKKVVFPFGMLLLAIPFPFSVLNAIVKFLQDGSAVMVDWLLTALGQSFVRDGTTFHLEKLSITIAPECSGIRSTMALVITGAVATEMFLRKLRLKIGLIVLLIPLSLLKNAIRIVTIAMLAQYVDMKFLTDSFLHHSGGIFFYLIVLAIYFPLLFVFAKLETKSKQPAVIINGTEN